MAIKAKISDLGRNIWQHVNIQENTVRKVYNSSVEGLSVALWTTNMHPVIDIKEKWYNFYQRREEGKKKKKVKQKQFGLRDERKKWRQLFEQVSMKSSLLKKETTYV